MQSSPLPRLEIDQSDCIDYQASSNLEWWLTNGIGGYAGGTVSGALTRRYHGLLIAPVDLPLGRKLIMTKADVSLQLDNKVIPLHTNSWHQGEVNPQGLKHIQRFYLEGNMPVWLYKVGQLSIEQRIWMTHGKNQTCVAFRLLNPEDVKTEAVRLKCNLIMGYRDHHHVNHAGDYSILSHYQNDSVTLVYPNNKTFYLKLENASFTPDNTWYENFFLTQEQARGLEETDNHLCIGQLDMALNNEWQGFVISDKADEERSLSELYSEECDRLAQLIDRALPRLREIEKPQWIYQLVLAADSFIFKRMNAQGQGQYSVIAGYPWFGDWGRDTMIALPGLCLATDRYDIAWNILDTFSNYISNGLLPNFFPGDGEQAEYNTVDASLWYIEAWRAFYEVTGDVDAISEALPLLEEIIYAFRDGTEFGIEMDQVDGLIRAGVPGQQLTWMDARANGQEVTPRIGKPVEINALWYNALQTIVHFRKTLNFIADEFISMAENASAGFQQFIRNDGLGLIDVLDGPEGNDIAIRPNQIFAISLTYSPLTEHDHKVAVLKTCHDFLLTAVGLRSLSRDGPSYVGHYDGGVAQRDGSYHQGTVWGWLLGHYALADFHVHGDAVKAQKHLENIPAHLYQAGIGQVSEIFDGDYPHEPKGAPAQAWSVACTLEAWWKLEIAKRDQL